MHRLSPDLLVAGAALIVAIIGVLYSRQMTAKRELLVLPQAPTPLLHKMKDDVARITVLYGERRVTVPYVTVLRLRSTGRNTITTEHFDQNRPLLVDIGASIVDVLKVSSTRGSFKVETSGTNVVFGPDLLAKKDDVEVHLLTNGEPVLTAEASPVTHYLIDTRVEYVKPGSKPMRRRRLNRGAIVVSAIATVAFLFIALIIGIRDYATPTIQASPIMVAPGGTINVNLAHLEDIRPPTVLFMGTKEPIHIIKGSAVLALRVPPRTARGHYFIVVLYSLANFPMEVEKSFYVQ
jgi:hypothetical protein